MQDDAVRPAAEIRIEDDSEGPAVFGEAEANRYGAELGRHVSEDGLLALLEPRKRHKTKQMEFTFLYRVVDYGEAREESGGGRGEEISRDAAAGFAGDVGLSRERAG